MKKFVCYTCIVGNYDTLKDPHFVDPNFDYICFSDLHFGSKIWKVRPIPDELKDLPPVKQQRVIKICPHRFLSEYEISVWVDGNLRVETELTSFVKSYDLELTPLYTRVHPGRKCIYDEAARILSLGKDTKQSVDRVIERYQAEGYPRKIGLAETCVLLRKNTEQCQKICDAWANEIINWSHRDQLSFNYVCWKNHFIPGYLVNQFSINNSYFSFHPHCG